MDASERAHAQMRQDLTSSGPGKDPSAAVDRFLCHQVHAAHQVKGGSCISKVLPVAAVERAGGRDEFNASTAEASAIVAVDAATPPPQPYRHPGSWFIRFRAMRMSSISNLRGTRAMPTTAEEMQVAEDRIKHEWTAIQRDPAAYEKYQQMNKSKKTANLHDREASANPAPGGDTCGDGEFRGVWGSSKCKDELMDPGDLLATRERRR